MGRSRLVVALIPPAELLADVQALRRSLGDPRIDRLDPHITLVPPLNVADEQLPAARSVLRAAAASQRDFELSLGPAATFAPATATVHLSVHGALEELAALRRRLQVAPLERHDPRPFVAHVTLRNPVDEHLLAAAVALLDGELGTWEVDRLTMLEQVTHPGVGTSWVPAFEVPFGAPVTVGRGGIQLELRTVGIVEAQVAALVGIDAARGGRARGAAPLVTSAALASDPDRAVGAVVGSVGPTAATMDQVVVEEGHRAGGVGSHLLARWCVEAARHGSEFVVARSSAHDELLRARGFTEVGAMFVRDLSSLRSE